MKNIRKYLGTILLGTVAGVVSLGIFGGLRCSKQDKANLEQFVQVETPSVVKELENEFCLKFDGLPKFDVIYEFNLKGGSYDNRTNTITINSKNTNYPGEHYINRFFQSLSGVQTGDFNEIMRHELGHYFHNRCKKKFSIPTSIADFPEKTKSDHFIDDVISEGIATYFQKGKNVTITFNDNDWPEDITKYFNNRKICTSILYSGGISIVKPIIDRFGEKGIDYLTKYPPRFKSLRELPGYRDKVIKELSNEEQEPFEKRSIDIIGGVK
jgi:hypothetical protein